MTDTSRVDVAQQRMLDALAEAAEARLVNGEHVALVQVEGEEPMICDFREAALDAVQQQRAQRGR